ncbi:MAG: group III truncated hemoglobin [Rhodospirillales bacterium]|nr:group III truncated hemoglobin [Rhodospirillales bacterium]
MKYAAVDAASIEKLVHHFYAQVGADPFIGPIFNDVIGENWDRHLQTMVTFWSSVMLTSGLYKGTPMAKHMALKNIEPAHFDRWLELFRQSTSELFEPAIAREFVIRAERIAESFKLGLFYRPQEFKVVNAPLGN